MSTIKAFCLNFQAAASSAFLSWAASRALSRRNCSSTRRGQNQGLEPELETASDTPAPRRRDHCCGKEHLARYAASSSSYTAWAISASSKYCRLRASDSSSTSSNASSERNKDGSGQFDDVANTVDDAADSDSNSNGWEGNGAEDGADTTAGASASRSLNK